jgi:hypothetical protein
VGDLTPNPELLRSLGRLARGLSCLFWGLPVTLLVCVHGLETDLLARMGVLPPVLAAALLFYGVWQTGTFQQQERVWAAAQERAQLLALFNLGLSPFLYWSGQVPQNQYFAIAGLVFNLGGLLFLATVNTLIERLAAMLPDATLRAEAPLFTGINRWLILMMLVLAVLFVIALQSPKLAGHFPRALELIARNPRWFALPFVLIALAMTMALLWKTKEVILRSVFGGRS